MTFTLDMIGRTNGNAVGDHGPGTLLVLDFHTAVRCDKNRPTWNHFEYPPGGGSYYRVADAAGNPPIASVPFADLDGVTIRNGSDWETICLSPQFQPEADAPVVVGPAPE